MTATHIQLLEGALTLKKIVHTFVSGNQALSLRLENQNGALLQNGQTQRNKKGCKIVLIQH